MEGLAAVGAASSIIQLVDFSLKLIATGKEIRDSLTGSTLQNEALEDVYQQMRSILQPVEDLAATVNNNSNYPVLSKPGHHAIRAAAKTAHKDCNEILSLIDQLKVKSGGHKRWNSLAVAFRSMMGQKKILEIETRLRTELASVSLELTKLTWDEVRKLNDNVTELIRKASHDGIQNDPQLVQLSESFAGLSTKSTNAASGVAPCSTKTLLKDVEDLIERAKEYDSVSKITAANQAVVNSLHFPSRGRRHEAIQKNHKETFNWIYNAPYFQRWIQDEGGIFWISGKPGSGKSTLMKFMADNPRTHACLQKWAHPYPATIAAHYFWNLGTDMQKSLLGLMRTLLFEILRKSPGTIQSACTTRWQMALQDHQVFKNPEYDEEGQWTMEELSEAIKCLEQTEDGATRSRLCLFVDGLDEFEGDHHQVCKLLTSLASLPHVKICLSSRPLNVFRDEFGGDETRQLAIHHLTGNDMKRFVNDHLVSHRNWGGGGPGWTINNHDKMSLVNEIRERANGVFLWVALVTKSICNGLTNQDGIHDLRERLRLLPTDLGDLFKHILDRIDPAYSKKSAEYLWIALHAQGPLPAEAYYFHERDHENENYAVEWPAGPSKVDVQFASRRITALTGGLLEVSPYTDAVTFLHRTVAEFLLSRDISIEIMTRMRPSFDVHLALAKISTVQLKCQPPPWGELMKTVLNTYLAGAGRRNFSSTMDFLDALEKTARQNGVIEARNFKEAVLRSPLFEQVGQKLSVNESYPSEIYTPPTTLLQERIVTNQSIRMLQLLDQHGYGLNQPSSLPPNASPWAMYFRDFRLKYFDDYAVSFGKLINIGADPNARISYSRCSQSAFSVYLIIPFSSHAGDLDYKGYLDTLDVFLDHGADFWQPITFNAPSSPVDERYWWPAGIAPSCNTVEKALSKGLQLLGSECPTMQKRDLVFYTVKRILSKRSDDSALMSRLRVAIPQAFPGHMVTSLLNMIPPAPPQGQAEKRKREGDEMTDMERPTRLGRKEA